MPIPRSSPEATARRLADASRPLKALPALPARPARALRRFDASRLAGRLALLIAMVLGLLPPAVWYLKARGSLMSELDTKARVKAELIQRRIAADPAGWRDDAAGLHAVLTHVPEPAGDEHLRITDPLGRVLAGLPPQPAEGPQLSHRRVLTDAAGVAVGEVRVSRPLRPVVVETVLVGLAGGALALAVLAALTRLQRREQRLLQTMLDEQERARVTLHALGDAVITTDRHERIDFLNPTAERLLRTTLAEARGLPLQQVCPLVDEATLLPLPHPVTQALMAAPTEPAPAGPAAVLRDDGGTLAIEHRTAPIQDHHGHVIGAVMVFHDVTTVRRMAQRLNWSATHDALTGLVNRRELEARVETALLSARNSSLEHVLCCLDLDQFKIVNDTCGHAAGDSLLKQIAALLQGRVREADTLARLDGDAFGVLLQGCGLDAAQRIAQTLLDAVRGYRFQWEDRSFAVGASIGLAALDPQVSDRNEVFAAAHTACLEAKEQGRNRVCLYAPTDASMSQRRSDMGWATRLTAALEAGRFRLWYQRYQRLADDGPDGPRGPVHVEILLRLQGEDGQLIPPGAFLPAAERYNLMPDIDRWVIEQVFAHYTALAAQLGRPSADGPALVVAINLSGTSINGEGLLEAIQSAARRHALPPGAVCFEITESHAVHNLEKAAAFMAAVRALGFCFALDDFGVGSSSFGYLKKLPVDVLKIDGGFVRDLHRDPVDRAMVETIHRVGHIMGLKTVAEYAETDEAIAVLRQLGVDFAQGYGVHRPEPLPLPVAWHPVPAGSQNESLRPTGSEGPQPQAVAG